MIDDLAPTGTRPNDAAEPAWIPRIVPIDPQRERATMRSVQAFHETALAAVELSVIVPTYNERGNLDELVTRLDGALLGVRWELIVVDDDSPDGTADHARRLYRHNPRVRVIRRIGRRGLASACIEGMLASSAPYLAVMDGDLQHDPAVLTAMLNILRDERTDLVVASRYMAGGSIGDWGQARAATSLIATRVVRALTPVALSDPMSGFFAMRREVVDRWAPRLSAIGFKIMLDIAMTAGPALRIREVPLRFASRQEGASKLSPGVAWDYAMMIADKLIGHIVPVRLVSSAIVGIGALSLHLAAMAALLAGGSDVIVAHAIATALALLAVYTIDNIIAHKPRPRRGLCWAGGLIGFAATSAIGALASVGIAMAAQAQGSSWAAGAVAGTLALLVWNYGAAARYSWRAA